MQISRIRNRGGRGGFSLIEAMAAVAVLAFIGTSVWVVINRCMTAAADCVQQMRAFEIARENMENLLASDAVEAKTDYGISEKYPDIQWRTTVETISDPVGSGMWAQAVCSAEYTNATGEVKTVELTHWLTELSKEQMNMLSALTQQQSAQLNEYIIREEQQAAAYAGVTTETIRQWVAGGMPVTAAAYYLKPWLELYLETNGQPSQQEKYNLLEQYPELAAVGGIQPAGQKGTQPGQQPSQQDNKNIPADLQKIMPPEMLELLQKGK